jgi:ankyrin repeat protein
MPKKNKNGNGKGKGASKKVDASAVDADDDLDDILAEILAGDLQHLLPEGRNPPASKAGRNSSNVGLTDARTTGVSVPEEILNDAIRRGDTAQLKRWGWRGVRVSSVTPLFTAVRTEARNAVLKILVQDLSADVNQADENGFTSLIGATALDQLHAMRCLVLDLEANVDQEDHAGNSSVCTAALIGNLAALRCLVKELGTDVNHENNNGEFPFISATAASKIELVRCLVKELGVDINQSTHNGTTALTIAAGKGDLDMMRCLVKELGADVNQATHDGRTPLMHASFMKHEHVVVWLLKNGADSQVSSNKFSTAVEISRLFGASAEHTAYLEARTHCAKPGCGGAGLKKCAGCLKVYFCSPECQGAFWPSHKAECKRITAPASSYASQGRVHTKTRTYT